MSEVAVIGLGLVGGSLALGLAARGVTVRGYDIAPLVRERARALCAVAETLEGAVAGVELVVLCTHPARLVEAGLAAAEHAPADAVFTDVGSVKGALQPLGERLGARFVPGHPIAGTEKSGPGAARADLFAGRAVILCPSQSTDPAALARVTALWQQLGARVRTMDAAVHDAVFARVSHLAHVAAFALMDAIAGAEQRLGLPLIGESGAGLKDTTRIAASDPLMWREVCMLNRDEVLAAIAELQGALTEVRGALERGDGESLETLFRRASDARRKL